MYEHNALGYWSGLALCLTKIRSSRARCPATALILFQCQGVMVPRKKKAVIFADEAGHDGKLVSVWNYCYATIY